METVKKISFIVPFYNVKSEELLNCINSIIDEEFDNYEIIIVNDGYENTEINKICKRLSTYDNIKYIYQENSGSAVARNRGIDSSEGDLIMFVDADDMLVSGFKTKLHNSVIVTNDFEFAIFDYSYWTKEGENIRTLHHEKDLIDDKNYVLSNILFDPKSDFLFGSIWAKIFRRDYLNKYNIRFKPELRKAQDRRFMLDVIYHSKKILYYPIYSYKYKINNNSICHKMNYQMIDYHGRLYDSIMEFKSTTGVEQDVFKYVEYYIFNEILPLSIFHLENKKKYLTKRKEFLKLYKDYSLDEKLKNIKYSDMPSINSQLKLFLYKHRCVFLLYLFFISKQRNIVKNSL